MRQLNFDYTLKSSELIDGVQGVQTINVDYAVDKHGNLQTYKIHLLPALACFVKNWLTTDDNIRAAAVQDFLNKKTAVEAAA